MFYQQLECADPARNENSKKLSPAHPIIVRFCGSKIKWAVQTTKDAEFQKGKQLLYVKNWIGGGNRNAPGGGCGGSIGRSNAQLWLEPMILLSMAAMRLLNILQNTLEVSYQSYK